MVLELIQNYFSVSEHIAWETIDIWPRLHFSGQRLIHRLRLRCQFENLAEMNILLLFPLFLINVYAQPWASVYAKTLYQSPERSTWQISCTGKEVLRKMNGRLSSSYHIFMMVPLSYHSKVTLFGASHAEKIAEVVLLFVFTIAFPASLLQSDYLNLNLILQQNSQKKQEKKP